MFSITSLDAIFNGVLPPHADDFRVRQHLLLLEEHKQWCLETIYGGRQMLWWCPSCASAWWQADGSIELHLPSERLAHIAHRVHASVSPDQMSCSLPHRTCAECLGAILSAHTYTHQLGCVLLWQPLSRAADSSKHLSVADLHAGSTLLALVERSRQQEHSFDELAHDILTWKTDEPCSLDGIPMQLEWISRHLPPPRQDECHMLSATNLDVLHRFEPPMSGWRWGGFLWQPPQNDASRMLSPYPLTLLLASIQPEHLPIAIVSLYARWQQLIPYVIDATGWSL